jgi:uncharacterized membrane protein
MHKLFGIPSSRMRLVNILACSSLLCILMVVFRMIMSTSFLYIFLCWNLFLAWIPMLVSFRLSSAKVSGDGTNAGMQRGKSLLLLAVWLLFFPNCPYIITDLIHLSPKHVIPLWFDALLILSFAWNGLMLGFISLFEVHRYLQQNFSEMISRLIILGSIMLASFGIYLGRFLRWNSWDVLVDPIDRIRILGGLLLHPFEHPTWLGVTIIFSVFLSIGYFTLRSMPELPHPPGD